MTNYKIPIYELPESKDEYIKLVLKNKFTISNLLASIERPGHLNYSEFHAFIGSWLCENWNWIRDIDGTGVYISNNVKTIVIKFGDGKYYLEAHQPCYGQFKQFVS